MTYPIISLPMCNRTPIKFTVEQDLFASELGSHVMDTLDTETNLFFFQSFCFLLAELAYGSTLDVDEHKE